MLHSIKYIYSTEYPQPVPFNPRIHPDEKRLLLAANCKLDDLKRAHDALVKGVAIGIFERLDESVKCDLSKKQFENLTQYDLNLLLQCYRNRVDLERFSPAELTGELRSAYYFLKMVKSEQASPENKEFEARSLAYKIDYKPKSELTGYIGRLVTTIDAEGSRVLKEVRPGVRKNGLVMYPLRDALKQSSELTFVFRGTHCKRSVQRDLWPLNCGAREFEQLESELLECLEREISEIPHCKKIHLAGHSLGGIDAARMQYAIAMNQNRFPSLKEVHLHSYSAPGLSTKSAKLYEGLIKDSKISFYENYFVVEGDIVHYAGQQHLAGPNVKYTVARSCNKVRNPIRAHRIKCHAEDVVRETFSSDEARVYTNPGFFWTSYFHLQEQFSRLKSALFMAVIKIMLWIRSKFLHTFFPYSSFKTSDIVFA